MNEETQPNIGNQPKKILIIDDDPIIRVILEDALTSCGFDVKTAEKLGEELTGLFNFLLPDLVILDIVLENQNGLDFVKFMDQLPEEKKCPIILLSSNNKSHDVIEGFSLGAIDYFVKPPNIASLVARCKELTARHARILIADDDPLFSELVSYELIQSGFTCATVESGDRVMSAAIDFKADLILLDRMMPGKEGLTIAKELLNNTHTSNIPIIIVSAKQKEEDIVDAFKLNIRDYITKPIRPKELVARVVKCLSR